MKNCQNKKVTGFTLIELMVTVALLAILITVGAPSLSRFIQVAERDRAMESIISAIKYARSEAVNKQRKIGVCSLAQDPKTIKCAGKDWSYGALVFEDRNQNGQYDETTNAKKSEDKDEVLKTVVINSAVGIERNRQGVIVFNRYGRVNAVINSTYTIAKSSNIEQKLMLSNSGRIRIEN